MKISRHLIYTIIAIFLIASGLFVAYYKTHAQATFTIGLTVINTKKEPESKGTIDKIKDGINKATGNSSENGSKTAKNQTSPAIAWEEFVESFGIILILCIIILYFRYRHLKNKRPRKAW